MKYSREVYAKVHLVAIAKLTFEAPPAAEFKYDRYPNGGAERIQSGEGKDFARKDSKSNWLASDDWGETGEPVDPAVAQRLKNWIGVIENRLASDTPLKFVTTQHVGDRDEFVFVEETKGKAGGGKFIFSKYKNDTGDEPPLLSEYSGPMQLGIHQATVDIKFSHMVSVKINDVSEATPSPAAETGAGSKDSGSASGGATALLDGKLKIDVPQDFLRDPDNPKEPKTVARFSHNGDGGAWGEVLRGTHGLTPDKLDGYLKMRVAEYSKGFNWLPKDAHLQWLRKDIVTIDGRKWADWRYVPMMKGKKDYRNSPVYTRFLTTSYKGQLLEITFTSNLNTEPAMKAEIDHIMDSVKLEE